MPLPQVPTRVRIFKGVDPADWTAQQRSDAALYALGGKFAAGAAARGVPRPPSPDGYYYPSPNDPYEAVETGDGTVEWRAKPNNQARPI
jgi:hypothetical protein